VLAESVQFLVDDGCALDELEAAVLPWVVSVPGLGGHACDVLAESVRFVRVFGNSVLLALVRLGGGGCDVLAESVRFVRVFDDPVLLALVWLGSSTESASETSSSAVG
jgi:hypothetical protein